jgi:hypothetical protein
MFGINQNIRNSRNAVCFPDKIIRPTYSIQYVINTWLDLTSSNKRIGYSVLKGTARSEDQGDQEALDHPDGQLRVLEEALGQHAQEAGGGYCEAGCLH